MMIVHQHVAADDHSIVCDGLVEQAEKRGAITVVAEDRAPLEATGSHVMPDAPRSMRSGRAMPINYRPRSREAQSGAPLLYGAPQPLDTQTKSEGN